MNSLSFKALSLAALAASGVASPVLYARAAEPNGTYAFTNPNGLNFTQMNSSLPNVTILATGGTIAGSSADKTATTGYKAGSIGIQTLINAVPEMLDVANVAGIQVANVGSPDVSSSILLSMAQTLNKVVCDDPTMSGAVVTHGTDTLEETAFFLDATVTCGKPIVVVGAMRPATAISADGPFNLLQSVTVATNPAARDRGALIVMNDRIVSAFYASKTNANTMDTFKAVEMGNLGAIVSNKAYFYYPPVLPTGKTAVDVTNITAIPRVDILYSYQDMHNDTLYDAVDNGAQGIVIAGSGAGSVSSTFSSAIRDVVDKHALPIVTSTRTGNGESPPTDSKTTIEAGFLNPQKARVLLGLLLAEGKAWAEIKEVFSGAGVA
ncbi:asparaginase ahrA [Aspergillus clavatus NRRL 1]|uniref:asparaginase n=1 Tax=Aspergillus clavatus (strain ATCC 1007 / CBS 513.65 / DSM 816 / NCTC 3887 / NRRL 1 / QM 1276 / 107) TaxID=344612 RepID=A1CS11_ASPCL|nr:L-asparaginase [Aspergillus clavatus NRRL 1]EAW08432.1 L-asparaginase [Aspergillus clavatus NRRL 1]